MIRINLLPYREKEKKKTFLRRIVLLSGSFVLFLLILVSVYLYFDLSIGDIEKKIQEAEVKLVVLNKKVGDMEGFKRDKKEAGAEARCDQIPGGQPAYACPDAG